LIKDSGRGYYETIMVDSPIKDISKVSQDPLKEE
jgi:hypothetical protein